MFLGPVGTGKAPLAIARAIEAIRRDRHALFFGASDLVQMPCWARHARWVPRSSSAVVSLNSQLRVLQMVHRTVSDERLWLHALPWNMTPRREGRRTGQSPYPMLGVDIGQGNRSFYDVLLDELAAAA